MSKEGVTPDPAEYSDRADELQKEWQRAAQGWRDGTYRLYGRNGLQYVRDWEANHLDVLEKLFVAQQQFNLMVVAAIDALRKDLADRSS